jgi:spermidine synthase
MSEEISLKKLYFVVFLTGAVVMALELAGSRILAPYLGTSISVWASLIGIILGAMSAGYYFGGKLADKNPNLKTFSSLIFLAGISVFIILIFKFYVLNLSLHLGVKSGSIFVSIALFALPALLLGMVSPYAVRLSMKKVENSGSTVGNLYAVSTLGSIFGTFFSGFYLIPNLGSNNILYALAISLFLISLFCYDFKKEKIGIFSIMVLLFLFSLQAEAMGQRDLLIDEDSAYTHIQVYDALNKENRMVRIMALENFLDSGMYLDSDELVFEYSKYYHLDEVFGNEIKKAAIFGGAAYSVPKDFLQRNSTGSIDVVEIDPRTTEIAKQYFRLQDSERMNIFHEDARIFLNRISGESQTGDYDVIYNDSFSSACAVPFQLTSQEAIEKIYNILDEDGVYIINLHSSLSGESSIFFRSEYKTLKNIFDSVYVFATKSDIADDQPQNIMILASKEERNIGELKEKYANNQEIRTLLDNYWDKKIYTDDVKILTDDFAPVSNFVSKFCEKR